MLELFQGDITIRTLLESLAEGVVIIDSAATIVMINQRTEELFGYSKSEVLGNNLNILIPDRFHAPHHHHVEGYFSQPKIRPMGKGQDLVGRRKDGREFPVEISLSHLDTADVPLAVAFITDITQRKAAEEALKTRNEELDAFAHMVAHDLKGSLTGLIGHSEMLTQEDMHLDAETVRESLNHIHNSGCKMAGIIDELLLLASVSKDEVEVDLLDNGALVTEALKRLEHACEAREAKISVVEDFPPACGYGPWVEEIWYNYISNALTHGGSPPRIEIGGRMTTQGMTEFWVKDSGPGISDEDQKGLFTPRGQRDRKAGGHGLGLLIVKRIAHKLNGQVGVESRPGEGSRFTFSLPTPGA